MKSAVRKLSNSDLVSAWSEALEEWAGEPSNRKLQKMADYYEDEVIRRLKEAADCRGSSTTTALP